MFGMDSPIYTVPLLLRGFQHHPTPLSAVRSKSIKNLCSVIDSR